MLGIRRFPASERCAAALGCIALLLLLDTCALAPRAGGGVQVHQEKLAGAPPGTCAWFGTAAGDVLYFGLSPFWAAMRAAGGDPRAGRGAAGPPRIGRFDLAKGRFLPPLLLGDRDGRGGTWDVLAHPNGRVYFTTFFGEAGDVDPATGRVRRFPALGRGLNELALGPNDTLLATRYGDGSGGAAGAVVAFSQDGMLLGDHPLTAPQGYQAAGKSIAFDPIRREIWVNTDLLPTHGGPPRHDVRVLARDGRELLRIASPEVEFMAFGGDGTGYFAEREGSLLRLRIRPPDRASDIFLTGRIVPLDDAFPPSDFVQDIQPLANGGAVVTRWSGRIHLVDAKGDVRDVSLPREPGGLYYTGVVRSRRLCATLCQGVSVVCTEVGG